MDWSEKGFWVAVVVGGITLVGVIVAIMQLFKKDKATTDNSVHQNIKGGIFYKSEVSQNIDKKKE